MRPLYLQLLRALMTSDSRLTGYFGRGLAEISSRVVDPLPLSIRKICDFSQPVDPFSSATNLPPIDLVVPVVAKDLPTVRIVIESAIATVRNPINRIRLITPRGPLTADQALRATGVTEAYRRCTVEYDEDIIPADVRRAIDEIHRPAGKSWVIQQIVKILAAAGGPSEASLVIDADTVLLRPRVWYAPGGKQILQCAHDYHRPYIEHGRRMFGTRSASFRMSYVTHHQLMQRDIVREMFGQDGLGLVDWLRYADFTQPSALSEYQSYGAYAMAHHPHRVKLARWGNESSADRSALVTAADFPSFKARIEAMHPGVCSISFHAWLAE